MDTSRISRKSPLQARARATFHIPDHGARDRGLPPKLGRRAARRTSREHPARSVLRARVRSRWVDISPDRLAPRSDARARCADHGAAPSVVEADENASRHVGKIPVCRNFMGKYPPQMPLSDPFCAAARKALRGAHCSQNDHTHQLNAHSASFVMPHSEGHPGRSAAARATNEKIARKKQIARRASASRVPVRNPETGRKMGYRSPFEMRDDGRISLTLFARLSTPTDQLGSWSSDPEAAPVRWLCIVHDRRDEKEFASRSDAMRANRTERETRASRREEAREAVVRRASARTTRARSEMDRRGGRARARGRRATATAT